MPVHYSTARLCILIQGVDNPEQAPIQRSSQELIHLRSLEDEAILEGSKADGARGRRSRDAPPRGCGGLWGFYPVHKALAQQAPGNRDVQPRPIPGPPARKREALEAALPEQVRLNPDLTLEEHCELFEEVHSVKGCNASMSRAFKRLELPLKKVPRSHRA